MVLVTLNGAALSYAKQADLMTTGRMSTHTHRLLTGGCLTVPDQMAPTFRGKLAEDMSLGTMPCLMEVHSLVFPMFVDLDLKLPSATLGDDALEKLAAVMNGQLSRFYANATAPFRVIVCTKTPPPSSPPAASSSAASPSAAGKGALFKHGVHLHWPDVRVNYERALEIRLSMVEGLCRVFAPCAATADDADASAAALLGHAAVDWEDAVDESVYKGGLRLLGAPKASDCPECRSRTSKFGCPVCGGANNRKVIDPAVYGVHAVLLGDRFDPRGVRATVKNHTDALRLTSVRCDEAATLTEGYARYAGCPVLPSGGKRKADAGLESRFKRHPKVTDPRILEIVRHYLVKFHTHYADSRLEVYFDGNTYRVKLHGDGASFCLNKNGTHGSNTVYMDIQRNKFGTFAPTMRCWCRKPEVRAGGKSCKDFFFTRGAIEQEHVNRLFPNECGDMPTKLEMLRKKCEDSRLKRQRREEESATRAPPTADVARDA